MWSVALLRSFILIAGFSIFLAACAGTRGPVSQESYVVKDDIGTELTLPKEIHRAVSLAPSITESIFAAGAGDRLVGVTTYCDFPEQAKQIQKVGDTLSPNAEAIIALQPDVVFVSQESQLEAFRNMLLQHGIPVFVVNQSDLEGVIADIRKFGELFGTRQVANEEADRLESRLKAVNQQITGDPKPTVFVQVSKEPLFTIGKGSFITSMVSAAGAISATGDISTAYPKLSKETAYTLQPDIIVLSESEDNREPNDVFKNSPAVKNGRVFKIDAALLARPGPRSVDALEQLRSAIADRPDPGSISKQ